MEKCKRNSNIEALRILCMLLIVAHHLVVHGGGAVTGKVTLSIGH